MSVAACLDHCAVSVLVSRTKRIKLSGWAVWHSGRVYPISSGFLSLKKGQSKME